MPPPSTHIRHGQAFTRYNLWLNGVADLVVLRERAVSDKAGQSLSMIMPDLTVKESNWGLGGVGGANLGHHTPDERVRQASLLYGAHYARVTRAQALPPPPPFAQLIPASSPLPPPSASPS